MSYLSVRFTCDALNEYSVGILAINVKSCRSTLMFVASSCEAQIEFFRVLKSVGSCFGILAHNKKYRFRYNIGIYNEIQGTILYTNI
jgi:hypothetical protein